MRERLFHCGKVVCSDGVDPMTASRFTRVIAAYEEVFVDTAIAS